MRILSVAYALGNEFARTEGIRSIQNASTFQRLALAAGSGLVAIFDPSREDMINAFGELTADFALPTIYKKMQNDPEGSLILKERPVFNSKTINLDYLASLPENTFGREYIRFLEKNKVHPDSRKPIQFIKDPDLAYVMYRYRQIHDFTHCILGQRTNMIGEVTVKIFEAIQLDLPMCWLAGLFGVLRLGPKHTQRYLDENLNWIIQNALNSKPLINVYFEKHFEKPVDQLRAEINLTVLPSNNNNRNTATTTTTTTTTKQQSPLNENQQNVDSKQF